METTVAFGRILLKNAVGFHFQPDMGRPSPSVRSSRPEAVLSGWLELPRTELAFADHPLVPIYLVFDSIERRIALPK